MEKILKAFANRRRLKILKYLKKKQSATVGDIADEIDLSFRSTSKHLGVLAAADVVVKKQIGPQVFYSISSNLKSVARDILEFV